MTVDDFIIDQQGDQQKGLLFFHDLFANSLNLTPKIRYKIPFYYKKSWVVYINPIKDHSLELAFTRGNELADSGGVLDFKGRKQIKSITFQKVEELPMEAVMDVIHEAILLDETVPYNVRKKK